LINVIGLCFVKKKKKKRKLITPKIVLLFKYINVALFCRRLVQKVLAFRSWVQVVLVAELLNSGPSGQRNQCMSEPSVISSPEKVRGLFRQRQRRENANLVTKKKRWWLTLFI
jgi:hypothetical protein